MEHVHEPPHEDAYEHDDALQQYEDNEVLEVRWFNDDVKPDDVKQPFHDW